MGWKTGGGVRGARIGFISIYLHFSRWLYIRSYAPFGMLTDSAGLLPIVLLL